MDHHKVKIMHPWEDPSPESPQRDPLHLKNYLAHSWGRALTRVSQKTPFLVSSEIFYFVQKCHKKWPKKISATWPPARPPKNLPHIKNRKEWSFSKYLAWYINRREIWYWFQKCITLYVYLGYFSKKSGKTTFFKPGSGKRQKMLFFTVFPDFFGKYSR